MGIISHEFKDKFWKNLVELESLRIYDKGRLSNYTHLDINRYKYRIISSVILIIVLNIITTDICIDFQLNARIFTLYSIGI